MSFISVRFRIAAALALGCALPLSGCVVTDSATPASALAWHSMYDVAEQLSAAAGEASSALGEGAVSAAQAGAAAFELDSAAIAGAIDSALDNLDEAPALLWAALNRERSLTADCRLEVEDAATGSTVVARSSGGPDAASALDKLDCGRWKLVCDRPADSQRRRIFHIFEGADSALSGLGDAEVTHDVEVARITTYHGSRVVRLALPEMDIDYDFELPVEDIATLRGIAA